MGNKNPAREKKKRGVFNIYSSGENKSYIYKAIYKRDISIYNNGYILEKMLGWQYIIRDINILIYKENTCK